MKKMFAIIMIMLIFIFSGVSFAQDSSKTGTADPGTSSKGLDIKDSVNDHGQHQTGTTESLSLQNNTNVDDWSQSLTDELKLDASQRDSVRSILLDYQKQRTSLNLDMTDTELSKFNSSFNDRIVNILEGDQVNSYKSYNQTWWNNINSTISNTGKNNNSDKNQQY